MPEPKRKMRANEIEAEIMRRIADHPDCGSVLSIGVHAATNAEAPSPTWAVGPMYRGPGSLRCTSRIMEIVSDLQREIDLST